MINLKECEHDWSLVVAGANSHWCSKCGALKVVVVEGEETDIKYYYPKNRLVIV